MGFASPYDVDAAGLRNEFQRRLIEEKRVWELQHDSFVTDRTTFDNLTYAVLHNVNGVDAELIRSCVDGMARYTHVIHLPVDVFCNIDNDPARRSDPTYQSIYDTLLCALLSKHWTTPESYTRFYRVGVADLGKRVAFLDKLTS
jgi:hypothetical protein